MPQKLKIVAIAAALAAGTSGAAFAQYACPAGYTFYDGYCRPAAVVAPAPAPAYPAAPAPAYPSGPLSGAAAGEQAGWAQGNAAAGPVGGIIGGAIGTATGAVAGTGNALAGTANAVTNGGCGWGYTYYAGRCYPNP